MSILKFAADLKVFVNKLCIINAMIVAVSSVVLNFCPNVHREFKWISLLIVLVQLNLPLIVLAIVSWRNLILNTHLNLGLCGKLLLMLRGSSEVKSFFSAILFVLDCELLRGLSIGIAALS